MTVELNFTINDTATAASVDAGTTLLSLIRDHVGLLGTKEGCNEGECGACTVLVDGKPVDACIYAAIAVDERAVTTVEALAASDVGSRIQEAFVTTGGVQCGFCTPGFVVTLTALLAADPAPSEEDVRNALVGNICRCTGYAQIIDAVAVAMNGKEMS